MYTHRRDTPTQVLSITDPDPDLMAGRMYSMGLIPMADYSKYQWLLDNSQIRQLADCQLADWMTRGLDISRTGRLVD